MSRRAQYVFHQPEYGYRSAVDGTALATFVDRPARHAVDLGAGAGRITLELVHRGLARKVTAVEADPGALAALRHNVLGNRWEERIEVVEGDVERVARARQGCADLVVSNPPYYIAHARSMACMPAVRLARHGDALTLLRFVRAARRMLGRRGRACFVWPARDLESLLACLHAVGLHARRMQFVFTRPHAPARRVMIEADAGRAGGLVVEPPATWYAPPRIDSDS